MLSEKSNRREFIIKSAAASLILPSILFGKSGDSEDKLKGVGWNKWIYSNPLSKSDDIKDFVLEGEAKITFPNGKMRMENALDPSLGQKSNFVFWCPEDFPSDISIRWEFKPLREPGLAILFFAAIGMHGESIFDPNLQKRHGIYKSYHSGDINAYHLSYFRRKHPAERAFHTCNLRKSNGFHLVAQGADPIPSVEDVLDPYSMRLDKLNGEIKFFINDFLLFEWNDRGKKYGPVLRQGKIGFRQMAPLIAEYSNLEIYST